MKKRDKKGLVIIQIIIGIALAGIIASAAAVVAVNDFKKAHTAEATDSLNKIREGAKQYFDRELPEENNTEEEVIKFVKCEGIKEESKNSKHKINYTKLQEANNQKIPSGLSFAFGKQDINVYIDKKYDFSVSTKSGSFQISEEKFNPSTIDICTIKSVADEIENSDNPQLVFSMAYREGYIDVEKKNFGNKLRFFIFKWFL